MNILLNFQSFLLIKFFWKLEMHINSLKLVKIFQKFCHMKEIIK